MSLKILIIFLFVSITHTVDPTLIKLSETDQCIKDIVSNFLHSNDCHTLTEKFKTQLSLKMTNCLLIKMNRKSIQCDIDRIHDCQIRGDEWNTFSTFFTHIDNLCHFYRQILWSKRAQTMISSLTSQAQQTHKLLQQNANETNQILMMQTKLKIQMSESILGQQIMMDMIAKSSTRISNLTQQIQNFVQKIHEDIDGHYSSLRVILSTISETLSNLNSFQLYLIAQVNSINGMIYFLILFIAVSIIGSFKKFLPHRFICLGLVGGNFVAQFLLSTLINLLIGTRLFRVIILIIILIIFFSGKSKQQKIQEIISKQLNTARLKRILRNSKNITDID